VLLGLWHWHQKQLQQLYADSVGPAVTAAAQQNAAAGVWCVVRAVGTCRLIGAASAALAQILAQQQPRRWASTTCLCASLRSCAVL
jgi:hypothetical protein